MGSQQPLHINSSADDIRRILSPGPSLLFKNLTGFQSLSVLEESFIEREDSGKTGSAVKRPKMEML